jgi:hypothetical protein
MFALMLDRWFKEMNIAENYVGKVSIIVIGDWKGTPKQKLEA